MKRNELKIIVTGKTGVGKTSITMLLEKFLQENGFEVDVERPSDMVGDIDWNYKSEKKIKEPHIDKCLDAIKEKTKVNLYDTELYEGINQQNIYGLSRILEIKRNRKYSEIDPYGEENWEE